MQAETLPAVPSAALFDMDSVLLDSPRLAKIKAHDIQTHHAPHMVDAPWLAVPMKAAREYLTRYSADAEETDNLWNIMASYCRVLEEANLLFYGMTEREAQDRALAYLSNRGDQRRLSEGGQMSTHNLDIVIPISQQNGGSRSLDRLGRMREAERLLQWCRFYIVDRRGYHPTEKEEREKIGKAIDAWMQGGEHPTAELMHHHPK